MIRYASVCDGIGAAHVAWQGLALKCAWRSEIDPYCERVMRERWPKVRNVGDMLEITAERVRRHGKIDLLVGGTPCQSHSVAGKRKGLDDPRGRLTLRYCELLRELRPRWFVWENVPGCFGVNRGEALGTFLGAVAECGYGFAYRVLDAQFFGIPQERRRVFVVGHLGAGCGWKKAVGVLFEPFGLPGHPEAGGIAQNALAGGASRGIGAASRHSGRNVSKPLTTNPDRFDLSRQTVVGNAKASKALTTGTHPWNIEARLVFNCMEDPISGNVAHCLDSQCNAAVLAYSDRNAGQTDRIRSNDGKWFAAPASSGGGGCGGNLYVDKTLRKLTEKEYERLQGFPDGYTAVSGVSKTQRYKMIGNSMPVPVMRWIGERIVRMDRVGV